MSLKFKLLAATATLALSVSSVSANEVHFEQSSQITDPVSIASIGEVDFDQKTGSANKIGRSASDKFTVVGSLNDLAIIQEGTGNDADMDVYTNNAGVGSIVLEFYGDNNDFDMEYGTSSDVSFSTIDIDVEVDGSTNTFEEVIAQTVTSFNYDADVRGSTNAIDTNSAGSVTTLDIEYDIDGDNNFLTVDTGILGGARDLDIDINGSTNNWTVYAKAAVSSTVDVLQTAGNNVTGTIEQTGIGSNMDLDLAAATSGAFSISAYDTSSGSSATINLTTLGAGDFDLYQNTNNSVYNVSMTLAEDGDIYVNM